MRIIHYTIVAILFVLASPLAFFEWIRELRSRSKQRQEAERRLFEDEAP